MHKPKVRSVPAAESAVVVVMNPPLLPLLTTDAQVSAMGRPRGNENLRFTIDGSNELEDLLTDLCRRLSQEVHAAIPTNRLEGILLGGGYGRGEGGVLKTSQGDRPYNDFESYIFLRRNVWLNPHRHTAALNAIADRLTERAGIHVEFKVTSLAKLRHSAIDMFTYDLLAGHRWILGHDGLLAGCDHHRVAERIPLVEATRLLMNRFSGLLFAQEELDRASLRPESCDFVVRNLAKAKLAMGDAVLTANGQYHWSCLERRRRMDEFLPAEHLPWLESVKRHHATGVEFKLHPRLCHPTCEELRQEFNALRSLSLCLWLWLESRRLGYSFASALEYANLPIDKCPEAPWWRNTLINAKAFGPAAFLRADARRLPRHRLLNALALLLWAREELQSPEMLRFLQRELGCSASALAEPIKAYRALWARFN